MIKDANGKLVKTSKRFELHAEFTPTGDQPEAIKKLVAGVKAGKKWQTLLGATGTGKTFTMANVIAQTQRPALILAHNKTLAAQLAQEFREFFPKNAVDYFISYYDYYQPEAYIAKSDTYIEKDASINEEIDKYRHRATVDLLTRNDVIVVASVSCIYGLGSPKEYLEAAISISVGDKMDRDAFIRRLTEMQYSRNDMGFDRGKFRVRGDVVEFWPPWSDESVRIEFFGDEIDKMDRCDPLTTDLMEKLETVLIPPAKHAVVGDVTLANALGFIENELKEQHALLRANGRNLEAARLKQRTNYDLEMLRETGFVQGIENYSLYMSDRWSPGEASQSQFSYGISIRLPEDLGEKMSGSVAEMILEHKIREKETRDSHLHVTLVQPFETHVSRAEMAEELRKIAIKYEEIAINYENEPKVFAGSDRNFVALEVSRNEVLAGLRKEILAKFDGKIEIFGEKHDDFIFHTTLVQSARTHTRKIVKNLKVEPESFDVAEIALMRLDRDAKNAEWEVCERIALAEPKNMDEKIGKVLKKVWDFEKVGKIAKTEHGVSNENWFVEADGKKYVVRRYREGTDVEKVTDELEALEKLVKREFPTVAAVRTPIGALFFTDSRSRTWAVFPKIEGRHPTAEEFRERGGEIAEIAARIPKIFGKMEKREEVFMQNERVESYFLEKNDEKLEELLILNFVPLKNISVGKMHCDVAHSNIIFGENNKISMIDFASSRELPLAFDFVWLLRKISEKDGKIDENLKNEFLELFKKCFPKIADEIDKKMFFRVIFNQIVMRAARLKNAGEDFVKSVNFAKNILPKCEFTDEEVKNAKKYAENLKSESENGEILNQVQKDKMDEKVPFPHGRAKSPYTLMHFFAPNFLTFIDESHMTLPQLGGMYEGNLSRKRELVKYGFRLPSCQENRPLRIEETLGVMDQIICVSATPGKTEIEKSGGVSAEQIIRPTGLLDPIVEVCPTTGQIDDILEEINIRKKINERALVTTLTKKMAEELSDYLEEHGVNSKYMHSDLDAIQRVEILRDLRMGTIDVVVGVNLLREGLDLPEISFIAILDAGTPGFLRSQDALVQTIGRAARNENGFVKLYCETESTALKNAVEETRRRRKLQDDYNKKHGITPKTIKKAIRATGFADSKDKDKSKRDDSELLRALGNDPVKIKLKISELETEMSAAVAEWDFERATELRDEIVILKRGLEK